MKVNGELQFKDGRCYTIFEPQPANSEPQPANPEPAQGVTDSGRSQKKRRLKRMIKEAGPETLKLFAINTNNGFDFLVKSVKIYDDNQKKKQKPLLLIYALLLELCPHDTHILCA